MADYWTQFSASIAAPTEAAAQHLVRLIAEAHDEVGLSHCEARGDEVDIAATEDPDLESLGEILSWWQRTYGPPAIEIHFAFTCSKPRLDGFGGGVLVVDDGAFHVVTTKDMVGAAKAAIAKGET